MIRNSADIEKPGGIGLTQLTAFLFSLVRVPAHDWHDRALILLISLPSPLRTSISGNGPWLDS